MIIDWHSAILCFIVPHLQSNLSSNSLRAPRSKIPYVRHLRHRHLQNGHPPPPCQHVLHSHPSPTSPRATRPVPRFFTVWWIASWPKQRPSCGPKGKKAFAVARHRLCRRPFHHANLVNLFFSPSFLPFPSSFLVTAATVYSLALVSANWLRIVVFCRRIKVSCEPFLRSLCLHFRDCPGGPFGVGPHFTCYDSGLEPQPMFPRINQHLILVPPFILFLIRVLALFLASTPTTTPISNDSLNVGCAQEDHSMMLGGTLCLADGGNTRCLLTIRLQAHISAHVLS